MEEAEPGHGRQLRHPPFAPLGLLPLGLPRPALPLSVPVRALGRILPPRLISLLLAATFGPAPPAASDPRGRSSRYFGPGRAAQRQRPGLVLASTAAATSGSECCHQRSSGRKRAFGLAGPAPLAKGFQGGRNGNKGQNLSTFTASVEVFSRVRIFSEDKCFIFEIVDLYVLLRCLEIIKLSPSTARVCVCN